jgi:Fe-S cluster assembly iron-binding protein IscA
LYTWRKKHAKANTKVGMFIPVRRKPALTTEDGLASATAKIVIFDKVSIEISSDFSVDYVTQLIKQVATCF